MIIKWLTSKRFFSLLIFFSALVFQLYYFMKMKLTRKNEMKYIMKLLVMSEFSPILISLVISSLVSLILLGLPFLLHWIKFKRKLKKKNDIFLLILLTGNLEMIGDCVEIALSLLEPLYMEAGDSSGVGPSQLPDLNLPAPREDSSLPDLNLTPIEEEILRGEWARVQSQKRELAELIEPLIEKEVNKYPSLKPIPSSREMVEELIKKMGSSYLQKVNGGTASRKDLASYLGHFLWLWLANF